jgi:hypothetical protein
VRHIEPRRGIARREAPGRLIPPRPR